MGHQGHEEGKDAAVAVPQSLHQLLGKMCIPQGALQLVEAIHQHQMLMLMLEGPTADRVSWCVIWKV